MGKRIVIQYYRNTVIPKAWTCRKGKTGAKGRIWEHQELRYVGKGRSPDTKGSDWREGEAEG